MNSGSNKIKTPCILGLTGGIGCGKTTATAHLAHKGIHVVDADIVARQVVEPNSKGLALLIAEFGEQILTSDGSLDRAKLRQIAFSSNDLKDKLNSILHPLIREELMNQLGRTNSIYSVLSAPLLFENNLHKLTRLNALIDLPEEMQIERTVNRDNHSDEETIKNIIKAQMPRKDKQKLSDIIIDNSQDKTFLIKQLDDLHEQMLKLCA